MRFSIEKILNAKNASNHTKNGKKIPSWLKFRNYIHKMEIVMSKSLFGFYEKSVPFVKVSLRNPQDINKLVILLEVRKIKMFSIKYYNVSNICI